MKFIVETTEEEWINEYQNTNPTDIQEEIRRQKVEIMLKQAEFEAEKSGKSSSVNWNQLKARFKWIETGDVDYSQIKSLISSDDGSIENLKSLLEDFKRKKESLKNPELNDIVYHYSENFEDGKKTVNEWGSKPNFGQEIEKKRFKREKMLS